MLVGMALFRLGLFNGTCSRRTYGMLVAAAVFVGIPVTLYGTWRDFASGWDFVYSFFYGMQINYWASLPVAFGWVGAVMLAPRFAALAAAGRMAFSNYILQTLICTLIFYGTGLGLMGNVERTGQFAIVAGVCTLELALSTWWLRRFRFGPLEWLWRSLTYWEIEPLR